MRKTDDELVVAFCKANPPSIPELVKGTGPFTWFKMGYRACEQAAEESAREEANEVAERTQ
jgi:hypothetical protein